MPDKRLTLATLVALVLQFVALLFAIWHGHRELRSLERRDAAIEKVVDHIEIEVEAPGSPPPTAKP